MPAPFVFSQRPELEQSLLTRLGGYKQRRGEQLAQEEGAAKGEALSRGMAGEPIEASLRLGARQGAERDISSYEANLGQEAAQAEEAQRAREYGTSERLGAERFAGEQAGLGRAYGTSERLGSQQFAGEEAGKSRLFGREERMGEQQFRTGERVGGQQFETDIVNLRDKLATAEANKDRAYRSGEAATARTWEAEQSKLERELRQRLQSQSEEQKAKQAEYDRANGGDGGDGGGGPGIGAGLGTAAGAGIGAILAGSVTGGLGAGAGAVIGGTIGGAVGSVADKLFCFHPDTPIEMADGSTTMIKYILPGMMTKGGEVIATRVSLSDGNIFDYKGVLVIGSHAVKENGVWMRVQDSSLAEPTRRLNRLVYNLVTSNHRIYSNGIEFADESEHDNPYLPVEVSIEELNKQEGVLIHG